MFKKANFLPSKSPFFGGNIFTSLKSGTNYFKFTSLIMPIDNGAPPVPSKKQFLESLQFPKKAS